MSAFLEVIGTIPKQIVERYPKDQSWIQSLLSSSKEYVRHLAAKIYAVYTAHASPNDFENRISKVMKTTKDKVLEHQQGALLALSYSMERKLTLRKNEDVNTITTWNTYVDAVKTICKLYSVH